MLYVFYVVYHISFAPAYIRYQCDFPSSIWTTRYSYTCTWDNAFPYVHMFRSFAYASSDIFTIIYLVLSILTVILFNLHQSATVSNNICLFNPTRHVVHLRKRTQFRFVNKYTAHYYY